MEHIGAPEDGEPGEVSAEGPSSDRHPAEIELGVLFGRGVKRLDLILERGRGQVETHGFLPGQSPAGRPPAVGDEDGEPLIRQPLRDEVGRPGPHHALEVRSSVRVEQHGERSVRPLAVGEQERGPQPPLAGRQQRHVRPKHRLGGERLDRAHLAVPATNHRRRAVALHRG